MRAIIIQDSDAANLLDLLKLEVFGDPQQWSNNDKWQSLPPDVRKAMAEQVHKKFHYIVCRWLQEQGASCVR
jgi:hypothetical protein